MSESLPYFKDWPVINSSIKKNEKIEQAILNILEKMTLEEKIGQMIQPNLRDVTPEEAKEYKLGSLLNGGGTWVNNDKYAEPKDWALEADRYWNALKEAYKDRPFWIPFMWATDAVHGHNNIFGATLYPHNIGLGAARDPDLIYRIGRATAKEVCSTGMDWTFAPTVATPRNLRWGRTYEGYSEDPEIVYQYSGKMVEGLQGNSEDLSGESHLLSTVKHWIGDGGTLDGIDRGDNHYSEEHLINIHAMGYFSGLEAGAQVVMSSFSGWVNDNNNAIGTKEYNQKLSGSYYLLTEVLKDKMNFDGAIISDWNSHSEVSACSDGNANYCVNAGLDILMVTSRNDWQDTIKNLKAGVKSGEVPLSRIDDAVTRILRIKMRAGLWEKSSPLSREYTKRNNVFGDAKHKALSREAVRKSLVLLKNKNNILPLSLSSKIILAGSAMDSIQKMTGGWSLTWQGGDTRKEDFPGCQTLQDAIRETISEDNFQKFSQSHNTNDIAIVAIGEDPYAEIVGDIKIWQSLEFTKLKRAYAEDLRLLNELKNHGKKIIIVFFSGRPLYVNELINLSDAFVCAWLPGTEGLGITDVLFKNENNEINFDFTGKLSYSWPNHRDSFAVNAIPSNIKNYQVPKQEQSPQEYHRPLFDIGYGLNYTDTLKPNIDLDTLPIDQTDLVTESKAAQQNLALFGVLATGDYRLKIADHNNWIIGAEATGNNSVICEGIESHPTDFVHQQDARKIRCTGGPQSLIYLETIDQGFDDLTPYLLAEGKIEITLKITQFPSSSVLFSIDKDLPNTASIDITEKLKEISQGEWQQLIIDIKELSDQGCDLTHVVHPMAIYTSGEFEFEIGSVNWVI